MLRLRTLFFILLLPSLLLGDEFALHKFTPQQLTDVYYSEGISTGDLNGDSHLDVVYGPAWFAGPDFTQRGEIYPPVPQNRDRYADHFFSWVYDFNQDGYGDVLTVGFPGTPAYVYENPGKAERVQHWEKHEVFDWVSNESPQFLNLLGDERPELVCTRDGFFGYVSIDWDQPFSRWTFHPISEQVTAKRFGHGLGVGDLNGDGRQDILHSKGWFEQPGTKADSSRWLAHDAAFSTSYGGAEMYAYDVDGDGDNDVITSEAAHDFGLSWYEQIQKDDEIQFQQHLIMGDHPSQNSFGVLFSELHSVHLADIDGDGLQDIVTGKTYYSHHQQSPLWDAGAVVYWFRLTRNEQGVEWIPYRADDAAGVGRQIVVRDLNGDGLPEILTGGMLGGHVLKHSRNPVSRDAWEKGQPQRYQDKPLPLMEGVQPLRGPKTEFEASAAKVPNAVEGESLMVAPSVGKAGVQSMKPFRADRWSGDSHLFWTGGRPGDQLEIPLQVKPGTIDLELVLTCAPDYAVVQLSLDDVQFSPPIDLYESQVVTTGVLKFPNLVVKSESPKLIIEVVGANPKAKKAYYLGIDYLRILKK